MPVTTYGVTPYVLFVAILRVLGLTQPVLDVESESCSSRVGICQSYSV